MVGCDQFLLEGIIALVGVGFKVCSTEAFGTHAPYSRIVQIEGNEVLSVLLCVCSWIRMSTPSTRLALWGKSTSCHDFCFVFNILKSCLWRRLILGFYDAIYILQFQSPAMLQEVFQAQGFMGLLLVLWDVTFREESCSLKYQLLQFEEGQGICHWGMCILVLEIFQIGNLWQQQLLVGFSIFLFFSILNVQLLPRGTVSRVHSISWRGPSFHCSTSSIFISSFVHVGEGFLVG